MSDDDLLDTEVEQSPEDAAAFLRDVAEKLESGEELTVQAGEESATVDPPGGEIEVEVELEREEGYGGEPDEVELEIELEWAVEASSDADDIEIE